MGARDIGDATAARVSLAAGSGRHQAAVVDVLTEAFLDDPLFSAWFPPAVRRERTGLLIRGVVVMHARAAHTTLALLRGTVVGAMLCTSPDAELPRDAGDHLSALDRVVMWRAGFSRAFVEESHASSLAYRDHDVSEPHWTVTMIGVAPHAQGRGIGRRLMRHAIRAADESETPLQVHTRNPRNMGLYLSLGFTIASTFDIPRGLVAHSLVRQPRGL